MDNLQVIQYFRNDLLNSEVKFLKFQEFWTSRLHLQSDYHRSKKCNENNTVQTFLYNFENMEVFEEPVPWTNKMPRRLVKFEASEGNRIVYDNLYC